VTAAQSQTILELRRRGQTYADIAAHIGSSANTVKSHCLRNEPTLRALAAKEICKHCGAPLTQREKTKRRSFCSDRCRLAWWGAHRDLINRKAIYRFTCLRCGCNFKAYGNNHRKFCSKACAYEARRETHRYDT
jgi:endogenous inhibitor of DNA gyrase (YacG/DUF329 family)